MSVVTRQHIVCLNSANRLDGNSSQFTISLAPALNGSEEFTHVCLINCSIVNSWYTIQLGVNDTFSVIESTGTTVLTIPYGNYSSSTMISTLNTLMQSLNYTYSPKTIPNRSQIQISVQNNSGYQPTLVFNNFLYQILGFNKGNNAFSGNQIIGPNVYNFQIAKSILVSSDLCQNNGLLSAIVPNVAYGSLFDYACDYPPSNRIPLLQTRPTTAKISLYNADTGLLLGLNGVDWNLTLNFTYLQPDNTTAKLDSVLEILGIFMRQNEADNMHERFKQSIEANKIP